MIDPEIRKHRIGGSEIGKILLGRGFEVWARKQLPAERHLPDYFAFGKALEAGILQIYSLLTRREIEYCDVTEAHPRYPFMATTIDARCLQENRGVDAKYSNLWREWGDSPDEIPETIELQMRWYMAAKNWNRWDVCALVRGTPTIYTIERDQELEDAMLTVAEHWWKRYLVRGERPPIDSSETAAHWLQQTFPKHQRPDLRQATPAELEMLREYAHVRSTQDDLKERRDKLEAQIKLAIADKEGLEWDDGRGRFTWRRTRDSRKMNWEGAYWALLCHLMKPGEERDSLHAQILANHTWTEEGMRKIYFRQDAADETEAA